MPNPSDQPLWFELSPEERQILGLREFLTAEVAPGAAERDQSGLFPHHLVPQLGQLGAMVPEEYGGAGLSARVFARILEEIGAVDGSLGLTVASRNSLCTGHIQVAACRSGHPDSGGVWLSQRLPC
jgi:alkylation response protein AidB-like acyl-CoA dehydrogenase